MVWSVPLGWGRRFHDLALFVVIAIALAITFTGALAIALPFQPHHLLGGHTFLVAMNRRTYLRAPTNHRYPWQCIGAGASF